MTIVMAAIFAVVCFGVAIKGFSALGDMTDVEQLSDARGYAWFWTFLGAIAVAFGLVSVWMVRTQKGEEDA